MSILRSKWISKKEEWKELEDKLKKSVRTLICLLRHGSPFSDVYNSHKSHHNTSYYIISYLLMIQMRNIWDILRNKDFFAKRAINIDTDWSQIKILLKKHKVTLMFKKKSSYFDHGIKLYRGIKEVLTSLSGVYDLLMFR